MEEENIAYIASVTHGFVGADLYLLCAEASSSAAKRIASASKDLGDEAMASSAVILLEDVLLVLKFVKPSAMREVLVEVPNVSDRYLILGDRTHNPAI